MISRAPEQTADWDEVSRRLWPIRQWWIRHPRVGDWIIVLACTGVQWLAMLFSGSPSSWLALVTLGITAFALLWRRTYPFAALLVVVGVNSVASILLPHGYQNLPFAFALYTVANLQGPRRALLGYAVGVLLPTAAALIQLINSPISFSPAILDPLALIALIAGIAVRSQRQRSEVLAQLWEERSERVKVTERARIAADMHDVVAHSLSTMIALANGAASAWSKYPERSEAALKKLSTVGRTALDDMSRILQLFPDEAASLGVKNTEPRSGSRSLPDLIDVFRSAGLPVRFTSEGESLPDDAALQMTVYRIVQECLTNTLRYATDPRQVEVVIATHQGEIDITVTDDAEHAIGQESVGAGRGLLGIASRAATYNGSSESGRRPEGGWRVHVSLHPETDQKEHQQ